MKSNKRKNIPHWGGAEKHMSELMGCAVFYLKASLKVDGAAFNYGRDDKGRPFVESARSGIIYDPEEFVRFAETNGKNIERAKHYRDASKYVMEEICPRVPGNYKAFAELLYVPMAEKDMETNTFKFVTVPYSSDKFSTPVTLFIHREEVDGTAQHERLGYDSGSANCKLYYSSVFCGFAKLKFVELAIERALEWGATLLGPIQEGVVLTFPGEKTYKIQTSEYKKLKEAEKWKNRKSM